MLQQAPRASDFLARIRPQQFAQFLGDARENPPDVRFRQPQVPVRHDLVEHVAVRVARERHVGQLIPLARHVGQAPDERLAPEAVRVQQRAVDVEQDRRLFLFSHVRPILPHFRGAPPRLSGVPGVAPPPPS